MAEINEPINAATEPTETVPMELDQPDEQDEVSLAELLGEEAPAEPVGEQQTGETVAQAAEAGAANPQPTEKK